MGLRASELTKFVVFLLEAIVIIVSNVISLVIFVKKFRHIKTYKLLINLSFADLLVGFYAIFFSIQYLLEALHRHENSSENLNQICTASFIELFAGIFSDLVILESAATLALIAVERAYAVVRPIRHRVIKTKYYRYGIVFTWCVNTAPVIASIIKRCDPMVRWLIATSLTNGMGLMYFSIMIASYVVIYVKIRFFPVFQHNANTEMQLGLCKTLFLTTLAAVIAYFPYLILHVCLFLGVELRHSLLLEWNAASVMLLCSNSFVNCLIYAWKMPAFRNELKKMFKCRFCKTYAIGHDVMINGVTPASRRNIAECHSNPRGEVILELKPCNKFPNIQAFHTTEK